MRRPGILTEVAIHTVLLATVCFALYPVLWVITLAFSPGAAPEPSLLPLPTDPSLEHMERVLLGAEEATRDTRFGELLSAWWGALRVVALGAALLAPVAWIAVRAGKVRRGLVLRVAAWGLPTLVLVGGLLGDHGMLFFRQLANSLLVAGATAFTGVAIATPAAYALSRFRFVGRDATMRTLLATQMFPGVTAAIPLFLILDALGLIDTHMGLILVYATTAVPFGIFQLRGAFDAIPVDLEEAAMVDGATRFGAFLRVVLPAARPAIAIASLYAFMTAWNEFILAATFLSREEMFTLPVVLQRYVGEYDAQWGSFAAGAIVVSLPVMTLFYWLQRHLVGGLTSGGVKG